MKILSYDIVGEAVRKFLNNNWPDWNIDNQIQVLTIFKQKYDFDTEWDEESCMLTYDRDKDEIWFDWDFCEGQSEVKDIEIYLVDDLEDFFVDQLKSLKFHPYFYDYFNYKKED